MRQVFIMFLVCQPAAILFAFCYTFWPALMVGLQIPRAGLHVAKTIWNNEADAAYQYRSEDGRTVVNVVVR